MRSFLPTLLSICILSSKLFGTYSEEEDNIKLITRVALSSKISSLSHSKEMMLRPLSFSSDSMQKKGLERALEMPLSVAMDLAKSPISLLALPYTETTRKNIHSAKIILEALREASNYQGDKPQDQWPHLEALMTRLKAKLAARHEVEALSLQQISSQLLSLEKQGKLLRPAGGSMYSAPIDPASYNVPPYFPLHTVFKPLNDHEVLLLLADAVSP